MERRDAELLLAGLVVGALLGIGVLIAAQWLAGRNADGTDDDSSSEAVGFQIEGDGDE